ncbi:glycoside hydrolase family 2 TIM barrel-domain containing protein [Enterococcus timonensis]|uniref:glycoside hydrolase family 2 TIM barrel-domain containing protein n=1 Tax=Enterococcus timonensis TaxID=1852364 RepID=UPI0009F240F5|nr:glycoside hydrolase family 2 TIM barrel-domain containing protein [Enterococcus timonensis]
MEQQLHEEEIPEEMWQKAPGFQPVKIPHDWLITDSQNLYRNSEGWYKKIFAVNSSELKKNWQLTFDGIYVNCEIYLNGQLAKVWKNGYTAFSFLLNPFLVVGENEIFVRGKHQAPNSRWYSGAGIYRNIYLEKFDQVYCPSDNVYLHTQKQKDSLDWQVQTELLVENPQCYSGPLQIIQKVFLNDKIVLTEENFLRLSGNQKQEKIVISTLVPQPNLWSPHSPNLYDLEISILGDGFGQIIHEKIGFREITLDANQGLFLNGQHLKIHGVCQHHDLGALGAAFQEQAVRRQLLILKEMGVNAIRTAHNPAARELLALTDELGFLVQSEFSDVWKHPKTTYDYAQFFDEWKSIDVKNWICRDRNHPSVFMWSIGNEIYDTHGRDDGEETLLFLKNEVQKYDFLQNATITFGSNYLLWDKTQKAADLLKVVGYNYGENLYEKHHQLHPDWIIYGSETGSIVQSRGVYHFPLEEKILSDDDLQCSSLGNSPTSWGAKDIEQMILNDRYTSYSMGQFIWTGTDYLGEPTPYHTKNSYFGQIDTAGFVKDSYYVYQAGWTDYHNHPMIHVFPYWDFSLGQEINVRVASNLPCVELFFNKQSLGKSWNDQTHGEKILHDWKISYLPGTIQVIGYFPNGKIAIEQTRQSFGDVENLILISDKKIGQANGDDIFFVTLEASDLQGNFVDNANCEVDISLKGPCVFLGADNGDSTNIISYQSTRQRMFNGKLLIMIGTTKQEGEILLKVSSKEQETTLTLESNRVFLREGISSFLPRQLIEKIGELKVPIRKISLINQLKSNVIDSQVKSFSVLAQTFPVNADTQSLIWRITDEKGIDSDLATMEIFDDSIKVTPIANGKIVIRCGVLNEKDHLDFYSSLNFEIIGRQEPFLNPYELISGGKYSRSNQELTSGNERGIATLRGVRSFVSFDEIEFGLLGADRLTLSLFPLEGNVFPIEIWQGYPYEKGSQLLEIVNYTKGTIWNTYQDQSFKLNQKLMGRQTISFVFDQKVHMKGFWFDEPKLNFQVINTNQHNYLYGDQFKEAPDGILAIGNNVTVGFYRFDFGTIGANRLRIYGQALERHNTVRLKILGVKTEETILLEFDSTEHAQWVEFSLPTIYGENEVEFIFLPGSNFNFYKFAFEAKSGVKDD